MPSERLVVLKYGRKIHVIHDDSLDAMPPVGCLRCGSRPRRWEHWYLASEGEADAYPACQVTIKEY